LPNSSADVIAALLAHGVRMATSYGGMIRAVTHLDVDRADMETAAPLITARLRQGDGVRNSVTASSKRSMSSSLL
jgi:hypothetical protein